jgi:hypothetical protein
MIVGKVMDDICTFGKEGPRTESTDVKEPVKACPHSQHQARPNISSL